PRPARAPGTIHRHRLNRSRWRLAAGRRRHPASLAARSAPPASTPAAEGGQMVVMVSEPEPLSVQIRDAAGASPGYACAAALRPDASGRMTWAQARVSDDAAGSVLVVQPVDDESQ